MTKVLKPLAIVLLAALATIQVFRPVKNINANATFVNDITTVCNVPNSVRAILKTSCYDCHSNNTSYPWYSNIQPVAWWLNDHIVEGKKELNFSEFATYRIGRQYKKLEEIAEQVEEDEMPLYSYTIIHRNAMLNKEQKQVLTNWANAVRDSIKMHYPEDSLKRPKRQQQPDGK